MHKPDPLDKVSYVVSDDPRYDVVKLRPLHRAPFMKLYNEKTDLSHNVDEVEYKEFFSENEEELREILDQIVGRNTNLKKDEIADRLSSKIESIVSSIALDMNLVSYKGVASALPEDARTGVVVAASGCLWIKRSESEWVKICTEDMLSSFITREEFESEQLPRVEEMQSLISGQLNDLLRETIETRATKSEFNEWTNQHEVALAELSANLDLLYTWREDEQARVDAWIEEKSEKLEQLESGLSALTGEVQQLDEDIASQQQRVASLSAWIGQITSERQEVVSQHYENQNSQSE